MKPQDLTRRHEAIGDFAIEIVTYRLDDTWHCSVNNADPGAVVARAEGTTRDEAERAAVETAGTRVGRTRVHGTG